MGIPPLLALYEKQSAFVTVLTKHFPLIYSRKKSLNFSTLEKGMLLIKWKYDTAWSFGFLNMMTILGLAFSRAGPSMFQGRWVLMSRGASLFSSMSMPDGMPNGLAEGVSNMGTRASMSADACPSFAPSRSSWCVRNQRISCTHVLPVLGNAARMISLESNSNPSHPITVSLSNGGPKVNPLYS